MKRHKFQLNETMKTENHFQIKRKIKVPAKILPKLILIKHLRKFESLHPIIFLGKMQARKTSYINRLKTIVMKGFKIKAYVEIRFHLMYLLVIKKTRFRTLSL